MFKWTCLATVVTFAMGCGEVAPSQSARTSTSEAPVRSAPSAPSGNRATADEIRRLLAELTAKLQNFEGDPLMRRKVVLAKDPYPPGSCDRWDFEEGHLHPLRR